jgi:hypothetical protein
VIGCVKNPTGIATRNSPKNFETHHPENAVSKTVVFDTASQLYRAYPRGSDSTSPSTRARCTIRNIPGSIPWQCRYGRPFASHTPARSRARARGHDARTFLAPARVFP